MINVEFRFYGELNDLLPKQKKQECYSTEVTLRSSVKDAIESQRIPHVEVAGLFVNDQPVGWDYILSDGDRITVYPRGFSLPNPDGKLELFPYPDPPQFVLDVHLGKLARYLRLLGFDTLYYSEDVGDETLAEVSAIENRILLTFDHQLLMRNIVKIGRLVRNRDPVDQIREIVDRFDLMDKIESFSRCINCNNLLVQPEKLEQLESAPPLIREKNGNDLTLYQMCEGCGNLYWAGSHTDHMISEMEKLGIEL